MMNNSLAPSLSKGGNINLSKAAAGLTTIRVGLGWDPAKTGQTFDLDAIAIRVGSNGQVRGQDYRDLCFFNQKQTPDGTITHSGDDLTGGSSDRGDDETIVIDLSKQPSDVDKIIVAVNIFEAMEKGQRFGLVNNAYIRVLNDADGTELGRYNLTEDGGTFTAMIFGEIYRYDGDWKFRALGEGRNQDLRKLLTSFGLPF